MQDCGGCVELWICKTVWLERNVGAHRCAAWRGQGRIRAVSDQPLVVEKEGMVESDMSTQEGQPSHLFRTTNFKGFIKRLFAVFINGFS